MDLTHYIVPAGLSEQGACSAYVKSITAFCDPTFKLMFGHFLRDSVGRGDTIDKLVPIMEYFTISIHRLGQMHALLMEFNSHARVVVAAEVVPLLLRWAGWTCPIMMSCVQAILPNSANKGITWSCLIPHSSNIREGRTIISHFIIPEWSQRVSA